MKARKPIRLLGVVAGILLLGLTLAPGAAAQVPFKDADFSGFATGSTVHVDAVQATPDRVLHVDEAFASAVVDSLGLGEAQQNEMETVFQPSLPDKKSFGRGSPLEVGLLEAVPVSDPGLLQAARVDASAPPTTPLTTDELATVAIDPVAYASLLRGQASARWEDDVCPIGSDISFGRAYAVDAQVLDLGGDDEDDFDAPVLAGEKLNPERNIGWTETRTRLVPQVDFAGNVVGPNWGLMTEVRQTIAPVSLFQGTSDELTIEFLGEWVMRAVALGVPGSYLHYGPGEVSPETPVLTIADAAGDIIRVITQDVFDTTGLVIPLPIGEIAVGEDPRAIARPPGTAPNAESSPTITDTEVSAAVDVVRVLTEIAELGVQIEDLRIGHMEVQAQVPAGGIVCDLKATKTSDPEIVTVGQDFTWTISVINPYDCILTNVRVVDTITTTRGIRYTILSQDPPADSVEGNVLIWNDVGPIPARGTKQLRVSIRVEPNSAAGEFHNHVDVTANCGVADAEGRTGVGVPLRAEVDIDFPKVTRPDLPLTGGESMEITTMALVMAVGALPLLFASRRLRRLGKT